jgi:hypothetical protein
VTDLSPDFLGTIQPGVAPWRCSPHQTSPEDTMQTIKNLFQRFDAYTLAAFNPPHVTWSAKR